MNRTSFYPACVSQLGLPPRNLRSFRSHDDDDEGVWPSRKLSIFPLPSVDDGLPAGVRPSSSGVRVFVFGIKDGFPPLQSFWFFPPLVVVSSFVVVSSSGSLDEYTNGDTSRVHVPLFSLSPCPAPIPGAQSRGKDVGGRRIREDDDAAPRFGWGPSQQHNPPFVSLLLPSLPTGSLAAGPGRSLAAERERGSSKVFGDYARSKMLLACPVLFLSFPRAVWVLEGLAKRRTWRKKEALLAGDEEREKGAE